MGEKDTVRVLGSSENEHRLQVKTVSLRNRDTEGMFHVVSRFPKPRTSTTSDTPAPGKSKKAQLCLSTEGTSLGASRAKGARLGTQMPEASPSGLSPYDLKEVP